MDMLKDFLADPKLIDLIDNVENVSALTENFNPKDLRHAAAKIRLKFGLGKVLPS